MTHIELIEEKYEELRTYIFSLCKRWQADDSRFEDILQNTIERLIIEGEAGRYNDNTSMWGRATNITREEIAKTFAARLPLSGVKFQAHWTATKALQKAQGDPTRAYSEQTGSSRVSRELMFLVAKGASLYSPEYLSEVNSDNMHERTSSLTQQEEDTIRVALSALTEHQANVMRLKFWQGMSYVQIAEELDITPEAARDTYKRAVRALRPILKSVLDRFM